MEICWVVIDHERDADTVRRMAARVSPDRLAKASRYRFAEDFNRSIVGELLVRHICRTKYLLPDSQTSWGFLPHGKPYLRTRPDLSFNLSHSGNIVACVFDNDDVGLDIEYMRVFNYASLAARYFADDENRRLADGNNDRKLATFYRIWTQKESFLKAVGAGLSMPLNSFEIQYPEHAAPFVHTPDRTWFLSSAIVHADYMLSVCRSTPIPELRLRPLTVETLAEAMFSDSSLQDSTVQSFNSPT